MGAKNPPDAATNGNDTHGQAARRHICVLQSNAEASTDAHAALDPYKVPETYDTEGKYEWHTVMVDKATAEAQVRRLVREGKFDLFMNLCDGAFDEDRAGIEVVRALEKCNVAYTGADVPFYEITKEKMKKLALYHSIPIAPHAFVFEVDMEDDEAGLAQVSQHVDGLTFPLIAKHFDGDNSVGMGRDAKVADMAALLGQVRKFVSEFGGALVEEFIEGREFTVLVTENGEDPEAPHVYCPVECIFSNGETFKHFDLKWKDFATIKWVPVEEPELGASLRAAASKAFVACRGASYGRSDFRVNAKGEVFFLEINPNCSIFYPPHAHGSADFILTIDPQATHQLLIDRIVDAALARHRAKQKAFEVKYQYKTGYRLLAARDLQPGDVVMQEEEAPCVLATRTHVKRSWKPGSQKAIWFDSYAYPVTDEVWALWGQDPDDWLPLNHSCDPNAWMDGLNLVARRPIAKGEEITSEYATFAGDHLTEFDCKCGAATCRGRIHSTDYLQPFVAEQYSGHLSDWVVTKRKAQGLAV